MHNITILDTFGEWITRFTEQFYLPSNHARILWKGEIHYLRDIPLIYETDPVIKITNPIIGLGGVVGTRIMITVHVEELLLKDQASVEKTYSLVGTINWVKDANKDLPIVFSLQKLMGKEDLTEVSDEEIVEVLRNKQGAIVLSVDEVND